MLTLYASYLQMKHINDQLEPALERILKLEPDNQVALYQLVQLAVHANDYPKVADICTRAIMHYRNNYPIISIWVFLIISLNVRTRLWMCSAKACGRLNRIRTTALWPICIPSWATCTTATD